MEINLADIKDVAIIAKPFVDPIISTLIKPKIKSLETWLKQNRKTNKVVDNYFENKFTDYFISSYHKFININVLVFPNQQINIKDIYQPLTITSSKDQKSFQVGKKKLPFISKCKRVLISDSAGMGKSTLSKWIGLNLIESKSSIPILIELRKLNSKNLIVDEIINQLDPIDGSFDEELLFKFVELGNFTFILDGFDEIDGEFKQTIIENVREFTSKALKNNFILTSRPESATSAFGDYQLFKINPLKANESKALITKYDNVSNNKVAKRLIKDVDDKENQVREFLTNPFLVSLLYKTYTYNKDIPSKKCTFYDDVYSALYKHHDLSKDGWERNKKSGLDIQDFRIVLRQLAFDTSKESKVEYSETNLIKSIKSARAKCIGIEFRDTSFSEDLELNVPIFNREGNLLKWAHKSIQDYFVAEYINNSPNKKQIVEIIFKSQRENYLNTLDFVYELDYPIFQEVIILPLINDFITFCEGQNLEKIEVKKQLIRERQGFMFSSDFAIHLEKVDRNKPISFADASEEVNKVFRNRLYLINTTFGTEEKSIVSYFGTSFVQEILNLIGKRGENLFIQSNYEFTGNEHLTFLDDDLLFLNNEVNSELNKKSNFEKINEVLFSAADHSPQGNFFLHLDKCKKRKEEIEKQMVEKSKYNELEGL